MKDLVKAMEVKVVFGLEAQGHLPTIKKILDKWNEPRIENQVDMTYCKHVWEEIGKEIGWCPFTAALSYFQIKNKQ
ncbi:hypothetical protein [Tenacibaculum halocynthiae]|uniref:hypothetical protein n=1 Tax=Tenacibaculum halocynthiae TaxID=1254437 RepID=UPI00389513BB